MQQQTVKITTEYIKLDQLLKLAGLILTGGLAKDNILSGKVLVNGQVCLMRGKKLRTGDTVTFSDHLITIEGG